MTTTTARPATDKQIAFATRLLNERNVAENAFDRFDQFLAANPTTRQMSDFIDMIMAFDKKPVVVNNLGTPATEGYYVVQDGEDEADKTFYKVVAAKGTGNLYAKRFSFGGRRWEYAPGVMAILATARRLSVEEAAEAGRATGVCVICGRELTDQESVARGIGPVCAARV